MGEDDSKKPGSGPGPGSGGGTERLRRSGPVYFEHERLDVFRVSREFEVFVETINQAVVPWYLRDQLDRAALSISANIAEGAGRTAKADKQRFYEIARGSTNEAAAHLDIFHIKRLISDAQFHQGRNLLARVAMMLTRMSAPPRSAKRNH